MKDGAYQPCAGTTTIRREWAAQSASAYPQPVAADLMRRRVATPVERVLRARQRLTHIAGAARTSTGRALLRRAWAFDVVGRETPSVAVCVGDLWYFVPTNDLIGKHTFLEGGFEQKVMEAALGLLEHRLGRPPLAGGTFVDIGANIGTSTIPALKQLGAGRAIAVEPAPANTRLLRANIAANGLETLVTVVETALSDRAGRYELEIGPDNSGDCRIRLTDEPGAIGEAGWEVEDVAGMTFDELLQLQHLATSDIDLVWMDTQGHEAQVLEGAASLLASDVPVISEYWPYGLTRAGGLDRLHAIIAANYASVFDVRASVAAGRLDELPATAIATLADRYDRENPGEYTDIALLK